MSNLQTDYTEIVFILKNPDDAESASDIANMAETGGIYIEDYRELEQDVRDIAHIDLIDEDLLSKDKNIVKIHLYIDVKENAGETVAYLSELYNSAGIGFEIEQSVCLYKDWAENWKKYFKPINIGEKILITPFWEQNSRQNSSGRTEILLEPGMAFGTGTHETTRLCLEMLEKYVEPNKTVLDVGCGSGILGIAAAKLGAVKSLGVDIDETSVKTANKNAEINRVEDNFTAICGDLTSGVNGRFDIIVANIVADIIMMLNKNIGDFMNENAVYIMSGIIDTREDEVLQSLKENSFEIVEIARERGWTAISAKKVSK